MTLEKWNEIVAFIEEEANKPWEYNWGAHSAEFWAEREKIIKNFKQPLSYGNFKSNGPNIEYPWMKKME